MPPLTDNDTIKDRVRYAFEEYETEADRYRTYCDQFRDSSTEARGFASDEEESEAGDTAEGGIQHLRTNIQTKQAFVTMADPGLYITMQPNSPPGYQEIAKAALTEAWNALGLTVQTKKTYLNRCVGGLGILFYRVDEEGAPEFDCIKKSDFAPDPHVTNWNKLRYASLRIKMPRDDFEQRYPNYARLIDASSARLTLSGANRKKNAIELKLYWDTQTEAVLYQNTLIDKDINHYGKPPFLFHRGDLSPDRIHDTGDYENALGLQAGLTILAESLHNQAQHGGGLNLFNGDVIPRRKISEGRQNGWIDAGAFMDRAIKRIEAEPLNPALLQAYEMERQAMDEATGVTGAQRGGPSEAKFATDLVIRANQSQGRADQERLGYELFCTEVAKTLRHLLIEFSNPQMQEGWLVVEALEYVASIRVIERSTIYKDPIASRNDAVQLFDKSMQAAGIGVPVDMVKIWLHLLRAFDLQDVEQFLLDQNALQQMMLQQSAMGGEAATFPPEQALPGGGGQLALPPGNAPFSVGGMRG